MTIDAFREKITEIRSEDADVAGVSDELMTDYAAQLEAIEAQRQAAEEQAAEVMRLTEKVNELAATNLKLIDKIKYHEPDDDEHEEPAPVTLENLFD